MKRWHLLSLTLLIGATLTGCAGDIVSSDPGQDLFKDRHLSDDGKFRNEHLLDRALSSSTAGKFDNEQSLQIVFAIDKQRVLERYGVVERYAVLERYRILERYHIVERYEYANVFDGFAITIDDSLGLSAYDDFLAELAQDDEILWYEPDFSVQTPTPSTEAGAGGQMIPWSVAAVGGQTSWTSSGNGSGKVDVDIYVLDTGVTHDDIDVVESLDMRDGSNDSDDYDGHGTHVAAIIGAVDDSDGLVGLAPGAKIHNIKVLDDNGTTDVSVVIAAVEEITARKLADPGTPIIVNMSIGENIGTPEYSALDYAIEASSAAGVVYVVAAGNQGDDAANVTPAKVSSAITVGSYNILGFFSSFSNWGPTLDILAPGEGVVSLAPGSSIPVSMSGTSMATAHVTGAAALYLAQHPNASTAEVMEYLTSRAQDFVVGQPSGTTTKSLWVGTAGAPSLLVDQTPTALSVQVSDDNDDAEEHDGDIDLGSSDLELVFESSSQQTVGIRFRGIDVPQGATITSASIQFTVDETDSGSTNLTLRGEAADDAAAYSSSSYNITDRPATSASANWAPAPWNSVGEAGSDQQTPDLAALVQEIVSRPGWSSGNSMAFLITGSGERTAESYDGSSSKAPVLSLEYVTGGAPLPPAVDPPTGGGSLAVAIGARADDVEQEVGNGHVSRGNADLELADDYGYAGDTQMIGLRFQGIDIPAGATITSAYIQFTAEESGSGSIDLTIKGIDQDDPGEFGSSDYEVSSRPKTSASANWAPAAWSEEESGGNQATSDLSAVIQEIVNRGGWSSGNSIAFAIHGSGTRTAYSWDNTASKAAVLHVTW